ncbi:MAG TPA: hypothetical protein VN200_03425 [Rhodoglobus sp.]|nr:hypothetical protein [Rhodoglobus sp.]
MLPETLPDHDMLIRLAEQRAPGSVSVHLAASPVPTEAGAARIALRNAAKSVDERLERLGVSAGGRNVVVERLRDLESDDEFWQQQGGRGIVVLAGDGVFHAFAVPHEITTERVAVTDRFELGPLLKAASAADRAWLLGLARGDVHLFALQRGRYPQEHPLQLDGDLDSVFDLASNQGQADMPRSSGPEGEKPEQERWAAGVRDAVLAAIGDDRSPIVLASGTDLERAYRAVGTSDRLLPDSLPHLSDGRLAELAEEVWRLVDARTDEELSQWRERFGTRRAEGLATSKLKEVALAATAAAVEELLFDTEALVEGSMDELGAVTIGESAPEPRYNLIEEIAARVLATGGTVRGVRNDQLMDGSPVAATLRYPITAQQ